MIPARRGAVILLAIAAAFTLASCTGTAPDPNQGPTAMPTHDESPKPADPDAEPTCETIIPASLVAEFESYDMDAQPEEFRVGEHIVDGGLQCTWGNLEVATDHVQQYGWAPLDATRAAELQQYLAAQGWAREEGAGVVYLTEDPEFAMTVDENGYGMTYEFGDGYVLMADTKQGLSLITWR
ncbi:hypothetical protein [Microbacterium sp. NPDC096154]|uniref:hypothetical protein n=1 Tax=Microbacterium sp. NPDC096154 TaxID=3155549 RepID=UPI003332E0BF